MKNNIVTSDLERGMKLELYRPVRALACMTCLLLAFAPMAEARKKGRRSAAGAAYEQIFRDAWPAGRPGGAVLVTRGNEVLYEAAYGLANVELGVRLEPDMVFRLASITKQFTAAAIMMLVEDGKVALDDPITKFLPDYPMQGHQVTVEHLLTHTSGIVSYTGIPGYMKSKLRADLTVEQLVDVFDELPMEFAPGSRFKYNNSGYILLGAIIEKAGSMSYAEFLEARIFGPLGMSQSYYGESQLIPRRVAGYQGDADNLQNAEFLSMTQPYAAGSLLSTVADMARWNRALFSGEVVKADSLQKMTTAYTLNDGKDTGYGYGLSPSTLRGFPTIGHGGDIHGFATQAIYLPEQDVYVVVLDNSPNEGPQPGLLARKAAAIAIGKPFREHSAIDVAEEVLRQYVGVYKIDDEAERVVTLVDGALHTQRGGGARLRLSAASETEFFYEGSQSWTRFVRDADGKVTGMEMFQGGAEEPEPAERISSEVPVPVKVDTPTLGDYVGVFELKPGFDLAITFEGGDLYGQATGQGKISLEPRGDDVFALPSIGAVITFHRAAGGKVESLVLYQGSQRMVGPRRGS